MFTSDLPSVTVGGTTVPAAILDSCQQHRGRLALLDDSTGQQLTFDELAHQIDRVGAALSDRALGRGDTIAIWAPNQPAWMTAALGAMAAGCTVTGIGPVAADPEVERQLSMTGAKMMFTAPALADRAVALAAVTTVEEVVILGEAVPGTTPFDELLASTGASPDLASVGDDEIAVLPLSSGTTGLPKRVELTHGGLVTMCRQTTAALPVGPADAVLALPSFTHVMGLVLTGLWPLSAGATVVTMPGFDPDRLLPAITERRLTVVAVPPMLAGLFAGHPAATPDALATVRLLGFGGAPTPPDRVRAVATRFPDIAVGQGYGMTELTCMAAASRFDDPGPAGSVGRLLPNTELRVVDPETGRDLPAGETGELLLRGPQVMAGYRDQPEETAATVDADRWLHTGDLGLIDQNGYLFVVDRIKELIKVKGYQVAPAELEAVLLAHPDVTDAAVTAVEADGDQRPVAFIVSASDPDPDAIGEWVAERVAPYKRLERVIVRQSLPRNGNGKILRRQLAATATQEAR